MKRIQIICYMYLILSLFFDWGFWGYPFIQRLFDFSADWISNIQILPYVFISYMLLFLSIFKKNKLLLLTALLLTIFVVPFIFQLILFQYSFAGFPSKPSPYTFIDSILNHFMLSILALVCLGITYIIDLIRLMKKK